MLNPRFLSYMASYDAFLPTSVGPWVWELLSERDTVVDVWHLLALANHGCCNFDRALELLGQAEDLCAAQGGDEGVVADLADLRAAVEDSRGKWREDVGADHRMGGEGEDDGEDDDSD